MFGFQIFLSYMFMAGVSTTLLAWYSDASNDQDICIAILYGIFWPLTLPFISGMIILMKIIDFFEYLFKNKR